MSAGSFSSRSGNSSVTATSDLPRAAPTGGLLARRRIAIARFGTDVTAAGGIGPALAAGLDPAGYPVVPGGRTPGLGTRQGLSGAIPSGTRSYTRRGWPNCTC